MSLASDDLLKSSRCLGADILMNLLSNYCRNRDIKTSITIGIVGWFSFFSLLMSFPSEFRFCQTYVVVVSYKTSSDAILINENAGDVLFWVF